LPSAALLSAQEDDAALVAAREEVVEDLVLARVAAALPIGAQHGKHANIVATADEVLRDDLALRGVQEDAGARRAALAGCARLGIADVPDDVVVDLVGRETHLHVYGSADGEHIGEHIGGDAAIGIADIQPQRIGVDECGGPTLRRKSKLCAR
jgi:hypothetical protein